MRYRPGHNHRMIIVSRLVPRSVNYIITTYCVHNLRTFGCWEHCRYCYIPTDARQCRMFVYVTRRTSPVFVGHFWQIIVAWRHRIRHPINQSKGVKMPTEAILRNSPTMCTAFAKINGFLRLVFSPTTTTALRRMLPLLSRALRRSFTWRKY